MKYILPFNEYFSIYEAENFEKDLHNLGQKAKKKKESRLSIGNIFQLLVLFYLIWSILRLIVVLYQTYIEFEKEMGKKEDETWSEFWTRFDENEYKKHHGKYQNPQQHQKDINNQIINNEAELEKNWKELTELLSNITTEERALDGNINAFVSGIERKITAYKNSTIPQEKVKLLSDIGIMMPRAKYIAQSIIDNKARININTAAKPININKTLFDQGKKALGI